MPVIPESMAMPIKEKIINIPIAIPTNNNNWINTGLVLR
jgi:hypothetical protein